MAATFTLNGEQRSLDDLKRNLEYKARRELEMRSTPETFDKFFSTYRDMYSGIEDGSILVVLKDGEWQFVDSKGRFKSKRTYAPGESVDADDVNSIVASVLLPEMLGASVVKGEDSKTSKSKYTYRQNSDLGQWVIGDMIGSNSDPLDFIRYDAPDPTTGVRGIQGRLGLLNRSLINLRDNYASLFGTKGWEENKANLDTAINVTSDGDLTDLDILAVNKVLGLGKQLRAMFTTEKELELPTVAKEQTPEQVAALKVLSTNEWMQSKYPEYNTNTANTKVTRLYSKNDLPFGKWTSGQINAWLTKTSTEDLTSALYNVLSGKSLTEDKSYRGYLRNFDITQKRGLNFIIRLLIKRNALTDIGNNQYIFPHLKKKGVYFKYDSNTRDLTQVMGYQIPSIAKKIRELYMASIGEPVLSEGFLSVFGGVPSNKEGGVLKAGGGTKLWYEGIEDYDPTKYQTAWNYDKWINGDFNDNGVETPYTTKALGTNDSRYVMDEGFTVNDRQKVKDIEDPTKNPLYEAFTNAMFDANGNLTEVGLKWALKYDSLLPEGSSSRILGADGKTPIGKWIVQGKDYYGNITKTPYTKVKDYITHLRTDNIVGPAHNLFELYGDRFYYKDDKGVKHWVDPEIAYKYHVTKLDNPVLENGVTWTEYELSAPDLTALDVESTITKPGRTATTTSSQTPELDTSYKVGDLLTEMVPNIINAGALGVTLRGNNRVAELLKQIQGYKIAAPYKYHYQEGNYGLRSAGERGAADGMNLASTLQTSDALAYNATQLDADYNAWQKKYQGYLADNQAIQTNRKLAEEYADWTNEKEIEARNMNAKLSADMSRLLAEIEANRVQANSDSVAAFMQGLGDKMDTRFKYLLDLRRQYDLTSGNFFIKLKYAGDLRKIQARIDQVLSDPKKGPNSKEYQDLIAAQSDLQTLMNNDLMKLRGNVYGMRYATPPYLPKLNEIQSYYSSI